MKKKILFTLSALVACGGLTSCNNEFVINVCASELPHKQILTDVVADILKEEGYTLKVTVLDWTIQNTAVATNEYDANYFQHIPYLETFEGDVKLAPAAKVHYEKLCVYTSNLEDKTIDNGDSIEIVNDVSNIERAVNLLQANNILTINESCYSEGVFKNFDINNPLNSVTFTEEYTDCTLTCISESLLCSSLNDYDFGVIPGNTAMTGLIDYKDRICFGETDQKLIDERANIIAVREDRLNDPKTLALVKALGDARVKDFIEDTYGDSVLYYYQDLTK